MADKRISQLVERVTLATNDVFPIVASGATTTNKVTLQTIDDYMQTNLDFGVTSVAMSVPTGLSVTGTPVTTTGTFVVTFTAGYSIPTNAKQTEWDTAYTNRITSATAPLGIASNVISITQSGASSNGYLSSTDWNTFNNKQSTITTGNLTEAISSILTITGGTGAVLGSGTSIEVKQASGSQDGFLDSADWTTFNGKQNALSGTGIVKSTGGTISYLTDSTSNWDSAYNDKINSAAVTGTTTKTLTLTQQDGGTIVATWTDDNTDAVSSVFGRTGAVIAVSGDYNTSQVTENTNLYYTDARARASISLTTTGTSGVSTYNSSTGVINIPNYTTDLTGYVPYTGATTNVNLGTHTLTAANLVINHASGSGVAASITKGGSGEALTVVKTSGSGNAASITGGVTLLSELHLTTDLADTYIASASNWNAAYNDKINSAAVTGTTTKTLTLTQQDGGTITASWTDINTDAVSSVFGRTGAVVATNGDYNTDQVTEGTSSLYFTNARARSSVTLTTTGTSGAATYNSTTGVFNIPTYTLAGLGGQAQLNGTGFVKATGTTITYDNSTYLTTTAAGTTYVPYTGATGAVDIGVNTFTSGRININSTGGNDSVLVYSDGNYGGGIGLNYGTNPNHMVLYYNSITALKINTAGAATFNNSVNIGTSLNAQNGYFAQDVVGDPVYVRVRNLNTGGYSSSMALSLYGYNSTAAYYDVLTIRASYPGYGKVDFIVKNQSNSSSISALSILGTGEATFANKVYINSSVGGQVLKVEGPDTSDNFISAISGGIHIFLDADYTNSAGIVGTQSNHPLIFRTNGTNKARFSVDGNLLINTTTDAGYKLDVNGTGRFSGSVGIGGTSTNRLTVLGSETGTQITTIPIGKFVNTGNSFSKLVIGSDNSNYDAVVSMDNNATLANCKLRLYIGNGTGSTAGHSNDQFVLQGNGNIGIGQATPSVLLDLKRAHAGAYGSLVDLINLNGFFPGYDVDSQRAGIAAGVPNFGNTTYGWLSFRAKGPDGYLDRMYVSSGGIYINSSTGVTGGGALQVNGNVNINGVFQINGTTIGGGGGSGVSGSGSTGYHSKWTGSTSLGNGILYDDGTRIGLNTASALTATRFQIDYSGSGHYGIFINQTTSNEATMRFKSTHDANSDYRIGASILISSAFEIYSTNAATTRFAVTSAGKVLIGSITDLGAYQLQVTGTIYATADVIAYSDISVKKNIRTIENALDRVVKSRGVLYDRKDIDSNNNIGFIAQELEEQFPELISKNEDGTKGVKYQNAVAVLFEAIKEQQKQIDGLKKQVA
jgi:hypothetical protein